MCQKRLFIATVILCCPLTTNTERVVFARLSVKHCVQDQAKISVFQHALGDTNDQVDLKLFSPGRDLILHVADLGNTQNVTVNSFPDRLHLQDVTDLRYDIILANLTRSDMGEYTVELSEVDKKSLQNSIHIDRFPEAELEPEVFAGDMVLKNDSMNVPKLDFTSNCSSLLVLTGRGLRAMINITLLKQKVLCHDARICQMLINTDGLVPGVTDANLMYSIKYLDQCTSVKKGNRKVQLMLIDEMQGSESMAESSSNTAVIVLAILLGFSVAALIVVLIVCKKKTR